MTVFAPVVTILFMPVAVWSSPVEQAPVVAWTEPRVVWETTGRTSNPILVTDAWGQVHLFFLGQVDGDATSTLYHARADDPDAVPVDVMLGVNEYRVAADPYGQMFVLTLGANNLMQVASADAADADRASAWAPARALGTASLGIDIIADGAGGLHLCYPQEQGALYQRSEDQGRTWTDPTQVAEMTDPSGIATYVRCTADSEGSIHVAWAEARPPNFYPPEGVFYARSDDKGSTWTTPEALAGLHYSLPAILADPRGLVHLLWQGDVAVGGRYYRQRPAGPGGAWSATETVVPAGRGGMSGDGFLALDSRGDLHAGLNIDGIYWATRRAGWSSPVELSASLRALPNPSGSIEQANLTIANGNEIYAAFEFDFKKIYLLSAQTDAPAAQATPLGLAAALGAAQPEAATATPARVAAGATPTADLAGLARALAPGAGEARRNLPLLVGAALAGLVVLWTLLRRRQG